MLARRLRRSVVTWRPLRPPPTVGRRRHRPRLVDLRMLRPRLVDLLPRPRSVGRKVPQEARLRALPWAQILTVLLRRPTPDHRRRPLEVLPWVALLPSRPLMGVGRLAPPPALRRPL